MGEAVEFTWKDVEARQDSSEEETPTTEREQKELLRFKRRKVEDKWKVRGYVLKCAVTTGGHVQPACG